eukprot:gene24258-15808_t
MLCCRRGAAACRLPARLVCGRPRALKALATTCGEGCCVELKPENTTIAIVGEFVQHDDDAAKKWLDHGAAARGSAAQLSVGNSLRVRCTVHTQRAVPSLGDTFRMDPAAKDDEEGGDAMQTD